LLFAITLYDALKKITVAELECNMGWLDEEQHMLRSTQIIAFLSRSLRLQASQISGMPGVLSPATAECYFHTLKKILDIHKKNLLYCGINNDSGHHCALHRLACRE